MASLREWHGFEDSVRWRLVPQGVEVEGSGLPVVWWFRTDGHRMTDRDWQQSPPRVGMFLNGEEIATPDNRGRQVLDESFIVLINAHHEDCAFTLPNRRFGERWTLVLTTADPDAEPGSAEWEHRGEIELIARSLVLLRRVG